MRCQDLLIRKLSEHSLLSKEDIAAIQGLPFQERSFQPGEDIVRQGDKPKISVLVLEGMFARYHTLQGGKRQYLSFHILGDMPDSQAIFIDTMDHSLCAIDNVLIASVPHKALCRLFEDRPQVGFTIWRETLIDAAIFREAITNNSARSTKMRLAHFLCEQYYRAKQIGLTESGGCSLPLTQTQLAETLASSLPSISRALITLRKTGMVELKNGYLEIKDWNGLIEAGDFNSNYMHLKKPAE